ncbi:TetR/AcrR family transcriptional regulator [Solimonas sp. K1W22B-7]|uniref:TetR/AcrR family transcriptional regulator n=1 Tax=Solimonas sp. K1W22B-7 TaxID=2303331 RepID=UPI0013C4F186|nr:TetR/AcrR family transcriptional regulator [Solimonas sp. K1W22B-7]
MPSITRRARARSSETQAGVVEALVGAMERLIAGGQSFTALSVEQLAREAGIARSTFYLHFSDKGQLVHRLLQEITREMSTAAGTWFAQPELTRREDLHTAIRSIVEVYERHHAVMTAVVETAAYDPEVAQLFHQMMDSLVMESRRSLRRIQQNGKAHPDATPEVADVLTWMLECACHQLLKGRKPAQRERLAETLTHIAWTAMFAPGKG